MARVVVVGAGVGGLTAAAVLARAGMAVTVLEAHVAPGGCAATFFHRGYRFDAGATLAGGFGPGGAMEQVADATGIEHWPARPAEPAMQVHLPGAAVPITRWGDKRRRAEQNAAFGARSAAFWRWQEEAAEAMWALALRLPPWSPQTPGDLLDLARHGLAWLHEAPWARLNPGRLVDALQPVLRRLPDDERLRLFVDAQLLIAAQATAERTNALYGAAALDLPRRGVVHLEGGMGALAETLAQAVRQHGGQVIYRQMVTRVRGRKGGPFEVETRGRDAFAADVVVLNLTPWNAAQLLGDDAPGRLRRLAPRPDRGWGACVVYIGLDAAVVPPDAPLHHQVIVAEPLGEGNSVFVSLSPAWDAGRAPAGRRAATLSTHTQLGPWWELHARDAAAYAERKADYATRMLAAAERAFPGLREAADPVLSGTPVTFERFTHRVDGWVGGFPQVDLFQTWAPHLGRGVWLVGDSIFPGQSATAVALGGLRVARAILDASGPGVTAR